MSVDSSHPFVQTLGAPDPSEPPTVAFAKWSANQIMWDQANYPAIGAGWYMNGFLQCFSVDQQTLERCIRHWSFLLDEPDVPVQPVAVNAYGAIAFLTDWNADDRSLERLNIIDPLGVSVFSNRNLNFGSFIEGWVPRKQLGLFVDDRVYDAWLAEGDHGLPPGHILGPEIPLTLDGAFEIGNFHVEPIEEYYASRGEVYGRIER